MSELFVVTLHTPTGPFVTAATGRGSAAKEMRRFGVKAATVDHWLRSGNMKDPLCGWRHEGQFEMP